MKTTESPYLKSGYRLADVIRAIQVMGTYEKATRKVDDWPKSLDDPLSADSWLAVFREHPEFFRVRENPDKRYWASLIWRRAYAKSFVSGKQRDLTEDEIKELSAEQREGLTRRPLAGEQIEALLKAAVELHSRAIAQKQESRWWIPVFTAALGFVGGIFAVVLGVVLKSR